MPVPVSIPTLGGRSNRHDPRSNRRSRNPGVLLIAAVLLSAACTTSGQATSIPAADRPGSLGATSLSALNAASAKFCPLTTLPAGALAAGLKISGEVSGSVEPVSGDVRGLTGVVVDCTVRLDGGSVSVLLIAGASGSAVVGLMPRLHQESGVSLDEMQSVLTEAVSQAPGSLTQIPGTAPVALRILLVDGAASAAVLVAGKGGPSRSQVEAFARALAHS